MTTAELLTDKLCFGEGPRWHEGALWVTDMGDRAVKRIDATGTVTTVVELPTQPAGLGWLPDGTLLVVSMGDSRVLRFDGRELSTHADLAGADILHANDMVVSATGGAYVGDIGFDMYAEIEKRGAPAVLADHPLGKMAVVEPDGTLRASATDLDFPNGAVITPDGATLIVAESLAASLTAFDIHADGSLHNRRLWAGVGQRTPDGICLDADGHIWMANAAGTECVLVAEGGEILEVIETDQLCFACALGGDDGRTLFMLTADPASLTDPDSAGTGHVLTARVKNRGADWR